MKFFFSFCVVTFCFFNNSLFASRFFELTTTYIQEQNTTTFDIFQRLYFDKVGNVYTIREHSLYLPLGSLAQLGIDIPHILHGGKSQSFVSRIGDIKVHLNIATKWFAKYFFLNFYLEYNTGTGSEYTKLETFPFEAYGFTEFRLGFIGFKPFRYISLHWNLFYVFRGEREIGLFDSFFNDQVLNIFAAEAWIRALGLNPVNKNTFFYYQNIANDNLEILLAINTKASYPFVPFLELTFSFDFGGRVEISQPLTGEPSDIKDYIRKAPASGIIRAQIVLGGKVFFNFDDFVFKFALFFPLGEELAQFYHTGFGLGLQMQF